MLSNVKSWTLSGTTIGRERRTSKKEKTVKNSLRCSSRRANRPNSQSQEHISVQVSSVRPSEPKYQCRRLTIHATLLAQQPSVGESRHYSHLREAFNSLGERFDSSPI